MNLLISIPAALLGSVLGSAVRGVLANSQKRTESTETETVINVSVSPVAGLVGGAAGTLLGAGSAFWIGAVLGAAGTHELDARLLGMVGVDLDALVAKAMEAAAAARQGGIEAVEIAPDAVEPAASA